MSFKRVVLTTVSLGAVAFSGALPVFADMQTENGYPTGYASSLHPAFPYQGSAVAHGRAVTSREIHRSALALRLQRGDTRKDENDEVAVRDLPTPDVTGSSLLRNAARFAAGTLRNAHRNILAERVRNGDYRILNMPAMNWRGAAATALLDSVPPPAFGGGPVETDHDRPSRRGIMKLAEYLNPPSF